MVIVHVVGAINMGFDTLCVIGRCRSTCLRMDIVHVLLVVFGLTMVALEMVITCVVIAKINRSR